MTIESLYAIALYLDRDQPKMAKALREAALELAMTRGQLRLTLDLLYEEITNREVLLDDTPALPRRQAH